MLYYIEYGCSQNTEALIVDAKSKDEALDYAYEQARYEFDSYDQTATIGEYEEYGTDEEYSNAYEEALENDIFYSAEKYDETNEIHEMIFNEYGVYELYG